jgi:hypothetical protein
MLLTRIEEVRIILVSLQNTEMRLENTLSKIETWAVEKNQPLSSEPKYPKYKKELIEIGKKIKTYKKLVE